MSARLLWPAAVAALIAPGCTTKVDSNGGLPIDTGKSSDLGTAGDDGAGSTPTSSGSSHQGPSGTGDGGSSGPGSTNGPSDGGTGTTWATSSGGTITSDTVDTDPGVLDVGYTGDVGDGPNCGESNYVVTPDPANVVLVLDASGSMVNTDLYWDHDNDPGTPTVSRWWSLHSAVEAIVGAFDNTINLGVQFFPHPGAPKDCEVSDSPEVPVAPENGAMILASLPPKSAFNEFWQNPTPTADGLDAAIDHALSLDPALPRALVLVSDGVVSEPCFNTHSQALAYIDDAYQTHGIPTYVVGVCITSTWADGYNAWALAGGVPAGGDNDFYDTHNEIELLEALQEIAGDVVSCIAPLDPMPPNHEMVQVRLDGDVVPPADDCTTDDGWAYVHPAGPYDAIELCGSTCAQFEVTGGEVLALYNCPPEG
jgi:hypothetical protein